MQQNRCKAYLVWGAGALFFLYQYFVRVIPSVIENTLEVRYNATTAAIASAVGVYLIIYAIMQMFIGPLFDSHGARKLFLYTCAILTLSCLLPLVPGQSLFLFGAARGLMGFASAFAFVGVLYLCTLWFRREQLAMLSGLTAGMGIFGAIIAQISLSYAVQLGGNVWIIAFILGGMTLVLLFFCIPQRSPGETLHPEIKIWAQCKLHLSVVGTRLRTWNLGLMTTALYAPSAVFADLWCIPYFTHVGQFTILEASQLASALNFTRAISAPILGWISDKKQSRKAPLVICGFMMTLAFGLLLLFPKLSFWPTACILSLIGFCSGSEIIGFVRCSEENPPRMSASAIAFINMIVMGLCGFIQAGIGWVIHHSEKTMSISSAYQVGLGLLVAFIFCSASLFAFFFKPCDYKPS